MLAIYNKDNGKLLRERRIALAWLASSLSVNHSTVYRWVTIGVRGVRLECFRLGGRRYTTHEAFSRWLATTNYEWTGGKVARPK